MAKIKSNSGDFYHDLFCNNCNINTSFKIHQFAMVKPLADKFKNAATAKCTVCGHTKALVLTGDLISVGNKSKPKKIINPENVSISKIEKKVVVVKKSFLQSLFQFMIPAKKSTIKKRGR